MVPRLAACSLALALGCAPAGPDCFLGEGEPHECPGLPRPDGAFVQHESPLEGLLLHVPATLPYERVDEALAEADHAVALNRAWGMPELPPDYRGPDDRFDVYFVPEGTAAGHVGRDSSVVDEAGCPSFAVVVSGDDTDDTATLHHELRHAFQFALTCFGGVLAEADATHAADYADPEWPISITGGWVEAFQAEPEAGLGETPTDSLYPYGASLFVRYLSERFADGELDWYPGWIEALLDGVAVADALGALTAAEGLDAAAALDEFAVWRLLTEDRTAEAPWTPTAANWPLSTRVSVAATFDASGTLEASIGPGGSVYPQVPADRVVRAGVDGAGRWSLQAVSVDGDGPWSVVRGDNLELPADPTTTRWLVVTRPELDLLAGAGARQPVTLWVEVDEP